MLEGRKPLIRTVMCGYKGRERCWGWRCFYHFSHTPERVHYDTWQAARDALASHLKEEHARRQEA